MGVGAFAVEELDKQIGDVSAGQFLGCHIADQGVDLGRGPLVFLGKRVLDVLCSCVGHDFGDALGLGKLLGQLHHKTGNGDAARRAEELGLVRVLDTYCGCAAHDIFWVGLGVVSLEISQLLLEMAHFLLEMDDIVARYFAALCRVVVFAVRVCALARPASRESGVAPGLALGKWSVGVEWSMGERRQDTMLTVRQRQQAVRVWAMRLWGLVEGLVLLLLLVVVVVAASSVE